MTTKATPSPALPLEYATLPAVFQSIWWMARRVALRTSILVVAVVLWDGLCFTYHRAFAIYWQPRCMEYSAPPTQVVCEQEPAAARALLASTRREYSDYWDQPHDNHFQNFTMKLPGAGPVAIRTVPEWAELAYHLDLRPDDPNYDRGATLFCGERFTPSGKRRLVVVQYNTSPTEFLYFSAEVDLVVVVLDPGSFFHAPKDVTKVEHHGVWFTSVVVPPPIRFYAGQADANDKSHFTVRYQVGAAEDVADGWLKDNDSIVMTPRNPILKRGFGKWEP